MHLHLFGFLQFLQGLFMVAFGVQQTAAQIGEGGGIDAGLLAQFVELALFVLFQVFRLFVFPLFTQALEFFLGFQRIALLFADQFFQRLAGFGGRTQGQLTLE